MSATYDAETYSSETYDTGTPAITRKHGMSFSIFSWSKQENKDKELEVIEREISIINKIAVVQQAELKTISKIALLRRGLIRFYQEIVIDFELGNTVAAYLIYELGNVFAVYEIYEAYKAYKAMKHRQRHVGDE